MAIDGMDNWLKKLETMKKDFPKETEKFLKLKAEETIGYAKRYTPVDTGTLRNSWGRVNGGKFRQVIFNNTTYAKHIEYPHRIVRGKKTVGFARGHYMLHKALNRTKLTFYRDLGKVYDNLIK